MSDHTIPNLAVIESRVTSTEKNLERLTEVVQELAKVVSDTAHAVSLIQQSQAVEASAQASIKTDVMEIKEKTNMLRGGWIALSVIGSVIVVLATAFGAVCAALALRHP